MEKILLKPRGESYIIKDARDEMRFQDNRRILTRTAFETGGMGMQRARSLSLDMS